MEVGEGCVEMKVWNGVKNRISFLLISGLLVSAYFIATCNAVEYKAHAAENVSEEPVGNLLDIIHDAVSYEEYLEQYANAVYPDEEIVIYGGDYTKASNNFEIQKDFMDYEGEVLLTQEEGSILWEFNVREAGFYNILIEYYPLSGKGSDIEREIYINGEIPFDGAQYIKLTRSWTDEGEIIRDSRDAAQIVNLIFDVYETEEEWIESFEATFEAQANDAKSVEICMDLMNKVQISPLMGFSDLNSKINSMLSEIGSGASTPQTALEAHQSELDAAIADINAHDYNADIQQYLITPTPEAEEAAE